MKEYSLKKVYWVFIIALCFFLHFPVAFSSSNQKDFSYHKSLMTNTPSPVKSELAQMEMIYDSLNLSENGLSELAFMNAARGYFHLKKTGKLAKGNILSIVDFTKPSTKKRLFILDMEKCKILFNTYVAHGQNSGKEFANKFSNIPESFQSSLGFYVTTKTYMGKNGFSLQLDGLEKGINDRAEDRAIVMHGAPYVSEQFIRTKGYLGRSWGCPAVPEKLNKPIIEQIKNGSCLFIFSDNNQYLQRSKILNA